jgi:uncharacterized protein YjbJ (UPF0337 family)
MKGKEEDMGKQEKVSNGAKDLKGKAKVAVGSATNNSKLVSEGKSDRRDSAMKGVKESLKDAKGHARDAVKGSK